MTIKPKLRWPLKVDRHVEGDTPLIVLSCPAGISSAPLALHAATAPILDLMRGELTCSEIAGRCSHIGATQEIVEVLVNALKNSFFLDDESFALRALEIRASFAAELIRAPALAGLAYPANTDKLSEQLTGYLNEGASQRSPGDPPIGIISPHIDYSRGHKAYGATWNAVERDSIDTVILIGTSHQYGDTLFTLCKKNFSSPLAVHNNNLEALAIIEKHYGEERSYANEFLHKREHSLELQIPFISLLNPKAEIVPILVGSFHEMIGSGRYPNESHEYEDFIGGLTSAFDHLRSQGKRTCVVAGIDMAHVGPSFGDKEPLTKEQMQRIAHEDLDYLSAIEAQDKKRLFQNIAKDGDARRVCGYPSAYTIIDLFDRLNIQYKSSLLDYRQAADFEGGCAVTFAGLALRSHP